MNRWILTICLLCATAVVGCKQQKPPPGAAFQEVNGAPLVQAFAAAQGDTQATVRKTIMDIQGSYYTDALGDLDKLASTPGLTDQQKKAVADLSDQVKKKAQEAAGAGQ
ncbi:MAG TPA: hypothetical protein VG146_06710 [Verrucomicrobiae bacterium]|nr:hypothetical protein [Verrucomicrobiae bacterium]